MERITSKSCKLEICQCIQKTPTTA